MSESAWKMGVFDWRAHVEDSFQRGLCGAKLLGNNVNPEWCSRCETCELELVNPARTRTMIFPSRVVQKLEAMAFACSSEYELPRPQLQALVFEILGMLANAEKE